MVDHDTLVADERAVRHLLRVHERLEAIGEPRVEPLRYPEISRHEIDKIQTRTVERNSWLDDELRKAFRSLDYRSLRYAVEDGTISHEKMVIMLSVPVLMENLACHLSEVLWKPTWFMDSVGES